MVNIVIMGHIICIASQKGGTGKTTTALNLAASLALFEQKTLLVDCDPLGNATTGLGINKKKITHDLYHALVGEARLKDVLVAGGLEFLNVIPARFGLFHAEETLALQPGREKVLRALLQKDLEDYKFIIIDSPASLKFLTICALAAADYVLIPIQCQIYALEGLGQLLRIVQQIRKKTNANLKVAGVLFTMYDNTDDARGQFSDAFSKNFKNNIFKTTIPWDKLLRDSSDFAKPLVLLDIMSKGARAYLNLAKEIMRLV